MKCILIDDETPARNIVKYYLQNYNDIDIVAECDNGFDGYKMICELQPDLVFLDVQMPKLNGFEMLEILGHKPIIIFTTAFDQYAIKAFENNAIDYLLKPFSKERFATAIEKAKAQLESKESNENKLIALSENLNETHENLDRIVVKSGTKINVVDIEDLLYIKAEDDYVMLHTTKGKFLKQGTMKFYEAHLPIKKFVRIHRSYIINIDYIDKMDRYEKETYIINLKNGETIKTSKSGAKLLKDCLNM